MLLVQVPLPAWTRSPTASVPVTVGAAVGAGPAVRACAPLARRATTTARAPARRAATSAQYDVPRGNLAVVEPVGPSAREVARLDRRLVGEAEPAEGQRLATRGSTHLQHAASVPVHRLFTNTAGIPRLETCWIQFSRFDPALLRKLANIGSNLYDIRIRDVHPRAGAQDERRLRPAARPVNASSVRGRPTSAGAGSSAATRPTRLSGCAGSVEVEHSLARRGAEKLWQLVNGEGYVPALGAITGSQAVQMVKAGLKAIYLSGWQVAGDGNLAESTYPGPEPLSGEQRSVDGAPDQQRVAPRRPDPVGRRRGRRRLARADPRRRGGRVRRAAERVRADEEHDRGGRCRRAFRGPALVGEEVRPSRRQGARADRAVHPHAAGGAPRRRRLRRADGARRAHGCALGAPAHERRRRARPRVPDRGAHARRASSSCATASSRRSRERSRMRRMPT